MAEHKRIFIPAGTFVPDPPVTSLGRLSESAGYTPYGGGLLSMRESTFEDPELDNTNYSYTQPKTNKWLAANCLHVHPTRVIVDDGGTPAIETIYFNVADLFIGGTEDIALREDFLNQFGTAATRNVSKTAVGSYGQGTTTPMDWSMASWSWDCVIATNYSDPVQRFVYDGTGTEKFADMLADGTSNHNADSIRAAFVNTLGRHVILANIWVDETDAAYYFGSTTETFQPDLVWWSATDDETIFGDEDTFPEDNTGWQGLWDNHGAITGLARSGDRALVVFKQNAIYLMELSGADELFHFTLVSDNVGTIWPHSIVTVGRDVYFISSVGRLCRLVGGTQLEFIGKDRTDGFFGTFYGTTSSGGSNIPYFTYAAYSPTLNAVFFQYKSGRDAGLYVVHYLIYFVDSDTFSTYTNNGDVTVQSANDLFPENHPCVAYAYDSEFYPADDTFDAAAYPWIVDYNPYYSFAAATYTPALRYLGSALTYSVGGATKIFSFGEQTVLGGKPVVIHAVRPIADADLGTSSISIRSVTRPYGGSSSTKSADTTHNSNGWRTVSGGGIAGQYFVISWNATTAHHFMGFEVEYSEAGVRD